MSTFVACRGSVSLLYDTVQGVGRECGSVVQPHRVGESHDSQAWPHVWKTRQGSCLCHMNGANCVVDSLAIWCIGPPKFVVEQSFLKGESRWLQS